MLVPFIAVGLAFCTPGFADEAALQSEINLLKQQVHEMRAQLDDMQSRLAANASAVAAAPVPAATGTDEPSLASPAARIDEPYPDQRPEADTTVGGYGQVNFNHYTHDSSRDQADLRRVVLSVGHRFSDTVSLNTEFEWEHAITSADDAGEAAIEQAWLGFRATPTVSVKAGLFLMPFGFLNLSHEPPVFHGVERNEVETRIIPTTWREGGVAVHGTTEAGFDWDAGITTGFDVTKFDEAAEPLGSIHQELQFARARDLAFHGALNYRGVPGLTVGGAIFRGQSTQGNAAFKADDTQPDFSGIQAPITLGELHARWQSGGLDLQALYARGIIGDAARIDATLQAFNDATLEQRPFVPAAFSGWLVQGAYTVWRAGDMSLTPFVRYERFDTQARMPAGFPADPATTDDVATIGLSFQPHPQVVFKADYQDFRKNSEDDRVDLGLGYMF